jgi:hypothetical protein
MILAWAAVVLLTVFRVALVVGVIALVVVIVRAQPMPANVQAARVSERAPACLRGRAGA